MEKTALPSQSSRNTTGDVDIEEEAVFRLEGERSQLHSRNKRFLSYPRYVEVMVTADAKMVHHHGQNLQHYVLTLMSIVSTMIVLLKDVFYFNYFMCM
jgi:thrombospondin motif-containing protein 20